MLTVSDSCLYLKYCTSIVILWLVEEFFFIVNHVDPFITKSSNRKMLMYRLLFPRFQNSAWDCCPLTIIESGCGIGKKLELVKFILSAIHGIYVYNHNLICHRWEVNATTLISLLRKSVLWWSLCLQPASGRDQGLQWTQGSGGWEMWRHLGSWKIISPYLPTYLSGSVLSVLFDVFYRQACKTEAEV